MKQVGFSETVAVTGSAVDEGRSETAPSVQGY